MDDLRTYSEHMFTNMDYNKSKRIKTELLLSMEPRGTSQAL